MYNTILMPEFILVMNKQKVTILDVRETDEFADGHIPGAIHFPLSTFLKNLHKIKKDTHYYIICASGARSQSASSFLAQRGFQVTNVLGGMSAFVGRLAYEM